MVSHAIADKCESGGLNKMCKSDLGKCSREKSERIKLHDPNTPDNKLLAN